ncbi:MAG: hypothetical protein JEY99_12950 [Spirochaetales bacterium]|nr:hypothetical protein [Spirochaetales bacterium]
MRIAISINGEGRGHITRMTALSLALKENHELFFWASERDHQVLKDTFGQPVHSLPPLNVAMDGNRVNIWRTATDNFDTVLNNPQLQKEFINRFEELRIELLISDFEPFLVQAANKCEIPVLQLNHPGIVRRSPSLKPDAVVAKLVARMMMGKYDQEMISSFYNGDIGPLIRPEIRRLEPTTEDFLVVYLRDGMKKVMLPLLDRIKNLKYRVFPSKEWGFAESLASCRGVITNSGHQLLSESLSLRKPVMAFPLEGQYEQRFNAKMLSRAGWGQVGRLITAENDLGEYLRNLDAYPLNRASKGDIFCFDDDTDNTVRKIELFLAASRGIRIPAAS